MQQIIHKVSAAHYRVNLWLWHTAVATSIVGNFMRLVARAHQIWTEKLTISLDIEQK